MRTRVYLKYNDNTNAVIVSSILPRTINVSNTDNIHTKMSTGAKGFQLSTSGDKTLCTLDGAYRFFPAQGYSGIVTYAVSGDDGLFNVVDLPEIEMQIQSYKFKYLYIVFDVASNEYATKMALLINGKAFTITNSDAFCVINTSDYVDTSTENSYDVTIQILEWSVPNASAKISYVASTYTDIFPGNTIRKFTCSENSLNNQVYAQAGIVEQYADIILYDRYKRIQDEIMRGNALSNIDVSIFAIDETGEEIPLGTYKIDTWDTDAADNSVSITCNDPSANFDKIFIKELPVKSRSITEMLQELFSYVPNYQWQFESTGYTKGHCGRIYTPDNWFKAGTLLDLLNKVCNLGLLRIYWSSGVFIVERYYGHYRA